MKFHQSYEINTVPTQFCFISQFRFTVFELIKWNKNEWGQYLQSSFPCVAFSDARKTGDICQHMGWFEVFFYRFKTKKVSTQGVLIGWSIKNTPKNSHRFVLTRLLIINTEFKHPLKHRGLLGDFLVVRSCPFFRIYAYPKIWTNLFQIVFKNIHHFYRKGSLTND